MSKTPLQASLFQPETEAGAEQTDKQLHLSDTEINFPKSSPENHKEIGTGISPEIKEVTQAKNIEKIVILYTDRSFREYFPSK